MVSIIFFFVGPIKHTLAHLWAMVWQMKSNVIVMVTKVFENGIVSDLLNYEVKCVFYLNSFIFMDNSEVVKLYFFYASPEKM